MKRIYLLLLIIFGIASLPSCLVEDEVPSGDNDKGPNLAGFERSSMTMGGVSNGDSYDFEILCKVFGPTSMDINSDVTITVEPDLSSTAVEGLHYEFPSTSLTLKAEDNLLARLPITMLTEGIDAPLDETPVLVLNVNTVSGDGTVIASGKPLTITLNYLCFSDLSGEYDATMLYTAYDGSTSTIEFTDVFTETGAGEYRTSEVGHWIGGLGVGTPGFTFNDVCNVITIPGQNLVDYYGNWVEGTATGIVDKETNTMTIDYSICYPQGSDNCRYYSVTYVKK